MRAGNNYHLSTYFFDRSQREESRLLSRRYTSNTHNIGILVGFVRTQHFQTLTCFNIPNLNGSILATTTGEGVTFCLAC